VPGMLWASALAVSAVFVAFPVGFTNPVERVWPRSHSVYPDASCSSDVGKCVFSQTCLCGIVDSLSLL
jgi:hypothetical protein